jgi:hypothetical protein
MVSFLSRALLAELLVGETLLVSYVVAFRLLGREPTLLRWVGVVVCGALLSSIGFHLSCAVGAFHLLGATLSLTVLTVVIVRSCSGDGALRRWLARDVRFVGKLHRRCRRSPYRWVAAAFLVASLPIVVRPLMLPPLAWDSLTYHAVKAAMWVQHAGAPRMQGPGTWAYYADMWAGGEVFTSWAMLPFHGDLLAMEVDAVEWLALGLALIALARELGIREPYASAAAGFALAVPTLRISVGSGYVEVALLMMAVSGWALAVRFLERGSRGAFYLSIGAIGVAAGIKFPFLPLGLLVVAAASMRAITLRASRRIRIMHAAAGILLFSTVLAPWPWNAYRQTGLPFSPLPVELFGERLGKPTPEMEWYMDRSDPAGHEESEIGLLKRALLEERMGPGATTMIAVAVSLAAWPFLWRRHALALVLLLSILVANWAEYYAPGLWIVRRYFTSSGVRFLLPALLLSVILSVAFCRRHPRVGHAYLLFLFGGTFFQLLLYLPYGMSASGTRALLPLIGGVCGVAAATRWISRAAAPAGARLAAVAILFAFALLGLSRLRDEVRIDLFRQEYTIHPIHPYWLDAAALVDQPDGARRIAVTSGPMQDLDNWVVYPLLGRALQNEVLYVPISRHGIVHHFGGGTRNAEYAKSGDFPSWSARLREHRVTEVMSFRPASIELAWMESHPARFRRLAGKSGDWGFFAVVN